MLLLLLCFGVCAVVSAEFFQVPLVPHHAQKHRRRLNAIEEPEGSQFRRRQDAVQVGALYQGYGTHYVDLWVGTPPQRQTLIVDTGSGVSAFPCSACTDCGKNYHIDDYFDERQSSSFSQVPCTRCQRGHCRQGSSNQECNIRMSYKEGSSWSAFEAKDICYIGGPHSHPLLHDNGGDEDLDPGHAKAFSFEMMFGCQTQMTGLFKSQLADGIMGMENVATSFWAQMFKHKLMDSKSFSLCYTRQPAADRKGNEAGAMTMGGYDERLHKSPLVYSAKEHQGGFFTVQIRKVHLRDGAAGESAKAMDPHAKVVTLNLAENALNGGRVIVDSGTTDTYFNRVIQNEFKAAYHQLTGKQYSHTPIQLTPKDLKKMPTILVQLVGDYELNKQLFNNPDTVPGLAGEIDQEHPYDVILAIPPSHYMEFDNSKGKYIARFYTDERSGTVIGANAMMGHDILFDIDNRRIGWAESDCDYVQAIESAGFNKEGNSTVSDSADIDRDERPAVVEETDADFDETEGLFPPNTDGLHPAILACSDLTCQGGVLAALVTFLVAGIILGRSSARKPDPDDGEDEEMKAGILLSDKN